MLLGFRLERGRWSWCDFFEIGIDGRQKVEGMFLTRVRTLKKRLRRYFDTSLSKMQYAVN